eukprot:scaffold30189_cov89-Skeletonema_dohrnii-CCMP3373.AAC.1
MGLAFMLKSMVAARCYFFGHNEFGLISTRDDFEAERVSDSFLCQMGFNAGTVRKILISMNGGSGQSLLDKVTLVVLYPSD